MSETTEALSMPSGVAADEFAALVRRGRQQGSLSADDVMAVLEDVELSPELIDSIRGRLWAEGIVLLRSGEISFSSVFILHFWSGVR